MQTYTRIYTCAGEYGTNWPQVKCVLRVPRVCLRVHVHMILRVTCILVWLRVVPLNYMRVLLLHKCRSINSLHRY